MQAAKKAAVPVERLREWETGRGHPSVAQLRALADLYKRPLAAFFLEKLPKDFSVLKFFRRLPDSPDTDMSPQLAIQLRQALVRREIALDLSAQTEREVPAFQLKAARDSSPRDISANIRKALGISEEAQRSWRDERVAFKAWREAVEQLGVLSFQVSRVPVTEMRGLSVGHDRMPIILLNAADTVRGRIFTLIHELAHLTVGDNRLCGSADETSVTSGGNEAWCNEVAGNVLVPALASAATEGSRPGLHVDWEQTRALADEYKVSQEVILLRLVSLGRLSRAAYEAAREQLTKSLKHLRKKKSKGGPAPDVRVISNLGLPFVRTVVDAVHLHRITLSEASDYLDVRVKHLPQIADRALGGYEIGADA